jgi:hypothetical protein
VEGAHKPVGSTPVFSSAEEYYLQIAAQMGEKRYAHRLLVGKRPLGRPRHRWVDNIKIDLVELGWGDVDWIALDKNRWRALVNSVLNIHSRKCWETIEYPNN